MTTVAVGERPQRSARPGASTVEAQDTPANPALAVAHDGLAGAVAPLPYAAAIQHAFGRHDVSGVRTSQGPAAVTAAHALGANAYTVGDRVAFRGTPDLRLAAHEAAHTVQQRGGVQLDGGVGQSGDRYEQQADQAAAAVVAGQSAEALLSVDLGSGGGTGLQRDPVVAAGRPPEPAQGTPDPNQAPPQPTAGTVPVVVGLDISQEPKRIYWSVAGAERTRGALASYLYGGDNGESVLLGANPNLPERVLPGRVVRPAEGPPMTTAASDQIRNAMRDGTLLRTQGAPEETATTLMMYTFTANGTQFRLSQVQLDGMLRGMQTWLYRKTDTLQMRGQDGIDIITDHDRGSNRAIRWISDTVGGVTLPQTSSFNGPRARADAIKNRNRTTNTPTQQSVGEDSRALPQIGADLDEAWRQWHIYINGTISGAENTQFGLEIVRDVSFGIAAGLAGAIAAPFVFGGAAMLLAGAGVTGTAATVLAGGVALVGGGLAGAGLRSTLETGGAIGGETLATYGPLAPNTLPGHEAPRFDWGYVGQRARIGAEQGFVDGFFGAAGHFVNAALAARLSVAFMTSRLGRTAIGGGVGAGFGLVGSIIDVLRHPERGPALQRILMGTGMGAGAGALFAHLPISGLYREGGTSWNPFSGRPTTPGWMLNAPSTGVFQRGSDGMGFINVLSGEALPVVPGCRWIRLDGNRWGLYQGAGGPRVDFHAEFDPAGNIYSLNVRSADLAGRPTRMQFNWTRSQSPARGGNPGGPMPAAEYVEVGTGTPMDQSHGTPHADTRPPAPGQPDLTANRTNFSPASRTFNRIFRRAFEIATRANGGSFREVSVYPEGTPPSRIANGTAIADGHFFIELHPNGTIRRAFYVPRNVVRGPVRGPGSVSFWNHPAAQPIAPANIPAPVVRAAGLPAVGVAPAAVDSALSGSRMRP